MGRPLSASFRALRDGRHPVREYGFIQGARPLPDFAGWRSSQPDPAPVTPSVQGVEEFSCSEGDPALLAFAGSPGTVPLGHSDPEDNREDETPGFGIELFDDEEFDYDPLGLGLSIT